MPEAFDVFLSHNSKDKPAVREIAEALKARGLKVWLDEWELVPGQPWQEALEEIIQTCRCAAVLVGKDGLGPWQNPEMRGCLNQMVERKLSVIPVLLPGAPKAPDLPLFLAGNTWVDLREGLNDDGVDRLHWGITGKKRAKKSKVPSKKTAQRPIPPHLHNLPSLPLGHLFKGREEDLKALEASLQSSNQATAIIQPHAIHGLGGIGKTRLAVEYAWRSGHRYDTAFFVIAESPEALSANLASLASVLDLPERQSPVQEEIVEAVLRWLRDHTRWLLILDNVDAPEAQQAVVPLLPRLGKGTVLITSRRSGWPSTVQEQSIEKLTEEEATSFLLQRTEKKRAKRNDDPEKSAELAKILDGLPLALEQAGAYISHHQMSFAEYLEGWEREKDEALSWYDKSVMQYPASMAVTWQTTYLQLGHTAKAILRLAAHLASDPIPSEMFVMASDRIELAVGLLCEETGEEPVKRSVKDALAELATYSIITRQNQTLTVHRMVQEVMRSRIPENRQPDWIKAALQIVNDFSPSDSVDVRTWAVWDVIRSHVRQISEVADRAAIAEPTARLLGELANLLYAKGLYKESEPLMRRNLEIREAIFGTKHHPSFAISLNNLAQLLKATNRFSEAEPLMRRALAIDEAAYGSQHPAVAIDLNNLASLLWTLNRFSEAEPMMLRALEIDEAVYGSQHPNVAIRLNNLAQLLQSTNRLSEAEPIMRRALEIDEAAYGSQHPNVARNLNNLAQLLKATNRLSEAEPMMRQAVEIFERSLGPDHPNTQAVRENLEALLQKIVELGKES